MVENDPYYACRTQCHRFELAKKMEWTGLAELLLANARDDTFTEFEDEHGQLISAAEYFGAENMSEEAAQLHREAGVALRDAGRGLQTVLLDGCPGTPQIYKGVGKDGADLGICVSPNASVVEFTEEDLL